MSVYHAAVIKEINDHCLTCGLRCSSFSWWSLAFLHSLSALFLRSRIISINPAFFYCNNRLLPLTFLMNTFGLLFTQCGIRCTHVQKMCKWSCKIVCILSNEIPSICVTCRLVRCGSIAICEPAVLIVSSLTSVTSVPELPSNSQLTRLF